MGAAVTVTVDVARWVVSARLVATTWQTPAVPGAVYTPLDEIVPQPEVSWTTQLTVVSEAPVTEALKVSDPPGAMEVEEGEMLTPTLGVNTTDTVATPWTAGSAWLIARTRYSPTVEGAV